MSENKENTNDNTAEIQQKVEALKKHVSIRDEMGGALYWNVLNEECCNMANELSSLGYNKQELSNILGEGTHNRN